MCAFCGLWGISPMCLYQIDLPRISNNIDHNKSLSLDSQPSCSVLPCWSSRSPHSYHPFQRKNFADNTSSTPVIAVNCQGLNKRTMFYYIALCLLNGQCVPFLHTFHNSFLCPRLKRCRFWIFCALCYLRLYTTHGPNNLGDSPVLVYDDLYPYVRARSFISARARML